MEVAGTKTGLRSAAIVLAFLVASSCSAHPGVQPAATVQPTATAIASPTARAKPSPRPTTPPTPIAEIPENLRETVQRFIDLNAQGNLNSDDGRTMFAGELAGLDVPSIGTIVGGADSILVLDSTHAVVRVLVTSGYDFDAYLYLTLEEAWKVTAMRAMALPGFVRESYAELHDKSNLSPIEKSLLHDIERLFFTDGQWREWFAQNHSTLGELCNEVAGMAVGDYITESNVNEYPVIEKQFTALGVLSIDIWPDYVQITVAGILDNSVGFICSPARNPPAMSSSGLIWVEEVAEGWYLFRTT